MGAIRKKRKEPTECGIGEGKRVKFGEKDIVVNGVESFAKVE